MTVGINLRKLGIPDKVCFYTLNYWGPSRSSTICNISVAPKSNMAASMSISCMLRQQPPLNTTFPQRRCEKVKVGWKCVLGVGQVQAGTPDDISAKSKHTHTLKQSTQSHPLAEFSAVLPSVLIPIILLILWGRPLKSCVKPQQSACVAVRPRSHWVKSNDSCSWPASQKSTAKKTLRS